MSKKVKHWFTARCLGSFDVEQAIFSSVLEVILYKTNITGEFFFAH